MSARSESLLGIWVDQDERHGKKISSFLRERGKDIIIAHVENISALRDSPNYSGYFAMISKESFKNNKFMLYLHLTLWHVYNKNKEATFVLVVVDEGIYSDDQNETCLKTEGPPVYSPINLSSIPTVVAVPCLNDDCLQKIAAKLQGPPLPRAAFLYIGNVGLGLAHSYFYGYLALILPDIVDRIKNFEAKNPGAISPYFLILIPWSSKIPAKFGDIDPRFSTIEEPLEGSIEKKRAGKTRCYQSYVHEIKHDEDCYRFCGEFATPIMALNEMLEAKELNEIELNKQVAVFTHTLRAIFQRHPLCRNKALVVNYEDRKAGFSLADELCQLIKGPIPTTVAVEDCELPWGATLQKGTVHIVNREDGKILADVLEKLCKDLQEISVRHDSLKNLLATKVNPNDTDEKDTASEKLFIMVTEYSKDEVEKVSSDLIQHPYWFRRTTFIVDEHSDTPQWLEKNRADYIEHRKVGHNLWNRIFGSLFGVSSVEGEDDKRWTKMQVTRQLNFPIAGVAKGLALAYYYNYLKLIGPKFVERIRDKAAISRKKMVTKLLILVTQSCHSCPTLEELADAVKKFEFVETLMVDKKDIAGNNRKYSTAIYKIPGVEGKQTDYLACVENCTPVLVLYEMEAEQLAGLSPQQKDAERKTFYEVLNRILSRPNAPEFCRYIKLIQYDDSPNAARKLYDVLVDAIRESL